MTPYLIFMDIDGTLVDDHQQISLTTKKVIRQLIAEGHHFFIASGRMLASAAIIAKELAPQVDVVGSNGAAYSLNGNVVTHHLGRATLKALAPQLYQAHLPTFFFTDHRVIYTEQLPKYFHHSDQNRIASDNPADYLAAPDTATLLQHANEIINGIIIDDRQPEQLAVARQNMVTLPNLTVSSSAPNNLELIPHGTSKATAIHAICQQLHQPLSHTMAFGDGENDLPMLKAAAVGVAMGNASAAVQHQADYVTAANTADGVAQFLQSYFKGVLTNG